MGWFSRKKPSPELEGEVTFVSETSGMVLTSDKQALSFDLGECRGFTPVQGQVVRVERVDGLKAWGLTLVTEAPGPASDPEAKFAGYQLTVLFEQALPSSGDALAGLLSGGSLGEVQVSSEQVALEALVDNLVITAAGHSLLAQQVHAPFPDEHMDQRNLEQPLEAGAAYLGISGPPIALDRLRPVLGPTLPNPWAPDGVSRTLHRVALRLLDLGGTAVVVNRGGELVLPAALFRQLSGDLSDPQCVPFGAWLDWALTNGSTLFRCWGMLAFGLIDLAAEVKVARGEPGFEEDVQRAKNAVLFGAMTSLRRNREFDVGEVLAVPQSVAIGPTGASNASDAVLRYVVEVPGTAPYWLLRQQ